MAHALPTRRTSCLSDGVVETVTCDKDQTTGERHACTCSDPLCECKERPIAHKHVWHRTRGKAVDALLTLSGRIKLSQISTEKGTSSEEHPSELQSLMRTSYAVSCLTKKTHS